jgi:predicted nucleic acid-binding protein
MYLLDTNVVSELRKANKADPSVRMWAQMLPAASLYLSAITILELETGVLLIERRDRKQGAVLRAWMDGHVLPAFSDRILAIDATVAQRCAALQVPNPRSDRDALIAATALIHGMTVATRNVSHFRPMGVVVVNPWEDGGAPATTRGL